jgi:DNA-binding response OmpR family regulator
MVSGPTVLIVEDEPLVLDVLREALEPEYRVHCARTAGEGFAYLRAFHIDIALVDRILPDGHGEDVAAFAEKMGTAVIAMSGHPEDTDGVRNRGGPYLLKPFGASLLLSTVGAVLKAQVSGEVLG